MLRSTSGNHNSYAYISGAFDYSVPREHSDWISFEGNSNFHWVQDLGINASKSSSIYKTTTTVKPKSIKALPLIRL